MGLRSWIAAFMLRWQSDESESRPNRVPRVHRHRVFRDMVVEPDQPWPRGFAGVSMQPDRRQGPRTLPVEQHDRMKEDGQP